MQIRDSFKKGSVGMMVLSLLEHGDLYGYEISQLIEELADGYISVPEGSLYPTLYKLQEQGMISSYRKAAGKRMVRVYYHIELAGQEYLAELKKEFFAVNDVITKIISYEPTQDNVE